MSINVRGALPSDVDLRPLAKYSNCLIKLVLDSDVEIQSLSVISQLQRLRRLALIAPMNDIDFLRQSPQLEDLTLQQLTKITDFSPLAEQSRLHSLDLVNCPHLTHLEDLPSLGRLDSLALSHSNLTCGLSDLVAAADHLHALSLTFLDWVSSLTPLSKLHLFTLTLWGCKNVSDISPIANQRALYYLDLEGTMVSDLAPLSGLKQLQTLWLKRCNEINDLRPLQDLTQLRELYIEGVAPGVDLAPLSGNHRLKVTIYSDQEVHNGEMLRGRLRLSDRY